MPPLDQKDANRVGRWEGSGPTTLDETTIPFEFQKEERNATMASVISLEQPLRLSLVTSHCGEFGKLVQISTVLRGACSVGTTDREITA